MAEISKITLPSGNTYDIKDAVARELIAGGINFIVAWDGSATPVPANIPEGVVVKYNGTDYTGTLDVDDATLGSFYLVKSSSQIGAADIYAEYVVATLNGVKQWEKLGDTQVDMSNVITGVTFNKDIDSVLGSGTTFTLASGSVTHGSPTTSAIPLHSQTKKYLETTSISGVSSINSTTANKSTWSFTMGTGTGNTETLVIGGGNGSDVVSTNVSVSDVTVATGGVTTTSSGSGAEVVVGETTSSTVNAITAMPTSTVGTTINVGNNDTVSVLTDDSSITVTKGS